MLFPESICQTRAERGAETGRCHSILADRYRLGKKDSAANGFAGASIFCCPFLPPRAAHKVAGGEAYSRTPGQDCPNNSRRQRWRTSRNVVALRWSADGRWACISGGFAALHPRLPCAAPLGQKMLPCLNSQLNIYAPTEHLSFFV